MMSRAFQVFPSFALWVVLWTLAGADAGASAAAPEVSFIRTPGGGLQPQAEVDDNGVVHLIYFKGKPEHGDIYYVRLEKGGAEFSAPIRVNSQPETATAIGTIRGAQLALGKGGRAHVIWNGASPVQVQAPQFSPPLYYTRMNDEGTAFAPQRNLITYAKGLDGGSSIAADQAGNVFAVWHARGKEEGEIFRQVYITASSDEGLTFPNEWKANPEPTGACGCCSLKAFVDRRGDLYILYRAAREMINRDSMLLVSRDKGKTFSSSRIDHWMVRACPMSSYRVSETNSRLLAAWETKGAVQFGAVDREKGIMGNVIAPERFGQGQKHPIAVGNKEGWTLLAWVEGSGWAKGGTL
ncbi:exo-alpha-sialidase, partial [Candidatus Sumerlaeota bacterium]|nr:exo-alpha-sialidase [Candidatus Sumerlaeota bacterium]